jgi:choline dehydrogenase-like flavoprotein
MYDSVQPKTLERHAMALPDHYDVIVIGSGPGGGSVAHRLAPTGKRILMLERGDYLRRSRANWDAKTVFVDATYQARETWFGKNGEAFHPGLHYWVGGNSKVYGSALFRLRERDFGELTHKGGVSPAWPLGYDAFEPYYCEAEALFHVHGLRGEDPNEPWSSKPYAYPRSAMSLTLRSSTTSSPAWDCIRSTCRWASFWTSATASPRRPARASDATPLTDFRARSMRRRTRR